MESWVNTECPFCSGELKFDVLGKMDVIVRCSGCGLHSPLFTKDNAMESAKTWASTRAGVNPVAPKIEAKPIVPDGDLEEELPCEPGCF